MDLVPHLGSISASKVEKVVDKGFDAGVELDPSALRGRGQVVRTKRKSKVVESIINRLKELGRGDASQLKHALAAAGMSESSLSTGLAILQKNGTIRRDTNGDYYLAVKEAAE